MSSIFSFPSSGPKPKIHLSKGQLPAYTDPKQPPTKKSPWRQIHSTAFISSVTVTLPSTFYNKLWPALDLEPSPRYAKVIMTLHDIVTGDFFTKHIKIGNVMMISEGTPGVSDWMCTLREGKLRIEMAREVYERCGLQGVPADRNGGARKHGRDRWVVELDLRAPAMVKGRKGYERLVRAVEGVLNQGKVWLFRDLGKRENEGGEDVIARFHPTVVEMEPEVTEMKGVMVPAMVWDAGESQVASMSPFQDDYYELVEWLDLVRVGSDQVTETKNNTDAYISRYSVPDNETAVVAGLTVVTWSGLLDSNWCIQLLIDIIKHSRKLNSGQWLALTINSHRTEALGQIDGSVTLLQPIEAGSGHSDSTDVRMEGSSELEPVTAEEHGTSYGLQQCTCFEFVDTVTV